MSKVPVFKISLNNATLLSGAYLVIAAATEVIRRQWNPRWIERVSLSLEAFPARTLDLLGLFEPLRISWMNSQLSVTQVRLIYAGTTVGIIFALGFGVGAVMWLIAKLGERRRETPEE